MSLRNRGLLALHIPALLLALAACGPAGGLDGVEEPGTGSGGGGSQPTPPLGQFREAIITYYDATGAGNCSFDPSPNALDVVALTQANLYENGKHCGACVEVEGPRGRVVARVVDSCPDCGPNHLDLSYQAFAKVANPADGRVPIRWRFVACNVQGSLRYRFKEGSSQWWTAIQVRNHRLPIAKLEWWKDGAWRQAPRTDYNYFLETRGMGTGALRIRVTATDGQSLEDVLPQVRPEAVVEGSGQFRRPSP